MDEGVTPAARESPDREAMGGAWPLDEMQRWAPPGVSWSEGACGLPAEARASVMPPLPGPDGLEFLNSAGPAKMGADFSSTFCGSAVDTKLSLAGLSFSELGPYFLDALQHVLKRQHRKTLSTAKDVIFPLPLTGYPEVGPEKAAWLAAILLGLNSMYGVGEAGATRVTDAQKKVAATVLAFLDRMWPLNEKVPDTPFSELFLTRGIDYRGDEIKLACSFTWKSISGALPSEVGSLELEAFCVGGCQQYVTHFTDYLLPTDLQQLGKVPKVMVSDEEWPDVVRGLLKAKICGILPQRELHHVGSKPVLNGLFSVPKNEIVDNQEQHRLIMNLIPTNRLVRTFQGDTGTLPTIAGFNAFFLEDSEIAMLASEDIKCFYYLFRLPPSWLPLMGFSKPIPDFLVPTCWKGEVCHLVSLVLPMGFVNSVVLAQHIHRNVARWSNPLGVGGHKELRRDRPPTVSKEMFRIYLDNWDEVRKVDKALVDEVEGLPSPAQVAMRHQYSELELPRHPKKAVQGSLTAEVSGAYIDGQAGVAFARPSKILKYLGLAWEVITRGRASQKELQVVAGGLVYICMFRRALLSSLNAIWGHIESLKKEPPVVKRVVPHEVKLEILRFCALVPLAQMDFRTPMNAQVTASDASSQGGGICASVGLTSFGVRAQGAPVRGELEEPFDDIQVLTVGLFDGIGALRVAVDLLRVPLAGHISVECNAHANRVVESFFPGTILVPTVQGVSETLVKDWACTFCSVGVVLLGAGPPCQGVSGLNSDRKGSQRDVRSSLYKEVPRIADLFRKVFPWAQVHIIMESVASMDEPDRTAMSEGVGVTPYQVDAAGVSLARRPRLYWLTWELCNEKGMQLLAPRHQGWAKVTPVELTAEVMSKEFLEPGWFVPPGQRLATFTTSRPSNMPGRRPAGIHTCDEGALRRWKADAHRYPPYQYKAIFGVHHPQHEVRVASIVEREVILGFPMNYTQQCVPKAERVGQRYEDIRKTLLGNSWSVPVVVCLVKQLLERLGLAPRLSIQGVVDQLTPGAGSSLQSILRRPPVRREVPTVYPDGGLSRRLAGLVSVKGEDLLLQAPSEHVVKYHRLRSSIPAKLWKWAEVAGWRWKGGAEHINSLELRAAFTTIRWLIIKKRSYNCRCLHLVDSLVVLHALSRGRSSSKRLRRTMMRLNTLLLAANLHPVWTYVHTSQNPADRPSRRCKVRKWGKVKKG